MNVTFLEILRFSVEEGGMSLFYHTAIAQVPISYSLEDK